MEVDGMKIREFRQRLFLSQEELAKKTGIGRATIARLEAGKSKPHGRTVRALASALNVEPQELVKQEVAG